MPGNVLHILLNSQISPIIGVRSIDARHAGLHFQMKFPKKISVSLALVVAILIVAVGLLFRKAADNYIHMALRAKRSEAPLVLNELQVAENAFFEVEAKYLPIEFPTNFSGRKSVNLQKSQEQQDLERLGYTPPLPLRCLYKVELINGGTDFEATAQCDLDQDGRSALFRATSHKKAEQLTDNDIY